MAMLPRSSNLYPLLLLQNSKNKHRKHHQPSRRHQSSLSDDSSIDSNNRHDDSLGINDTASESEPYVTGIERDSEYDREEEAEQGQGEEQDPEQASNAGSLRHWHEFDDDDDDESGFEPDSESDGSDTSLTLDDHPITNGISPDPSVPLHVLREQSTQRLAQAWLDIFERYGKEPSELPPDDEIDLATGELIVDNGVLRSHSQTLFGTLTKLGEDIKRPLKQERLRMRRKIHAITNAASHLKSGSRGRRIGSAEEKMWIKPVSNKARKNHMKGEITYGGDDFDNLLYIPTPSSAAFSDNSNASQPQQKEMEPQETEDRSCAVVEQEHNTHVPEPEGDNSEDVYDDDQDEYEQEQEHEDEENEGEAEDTGHEKEEDEEDEENYYRVEEDNKEDEEQEHYPVRPSAFVSGSIESQGRQETNQEASEDEGYPDEEGGRSSDVDDPVRARNSFDSSRPEDVSTYVTHRPVLSDTQPFSIRNSMSTVKATWDSTGMRSSLTWAASPIAGASVVEYSNYSNAEEAYEDKEEHAQDDDDIHHKPEMRSDNRWSPPLTVALSTPPRLNQPRLHSVESPSYRERSVNLRTRMTPKARALADSLLSGGSSAADRGKPSLAASPSKGTSSPSRRALWDSLLLRRTPAYISSAAATSSNIPTMPSRRALTDIPLSIGRLTAPPSEASTPSLISSSSPSDSPTSIKRNRASPDTDLDLDLDMGLDLDPDLGLDLDRNFLSLRLESPLKRKRIDIDLSSSSTTFITNPSIALPTPPRPISPSIEELFAESPFDDKAECAGLGSVCSNEFCLRCL